MQHGFLSFGQTLVSVCLNIILVKDGYFVIGDPQTRTDESLHRSPCPPVSLPLLFFFLLRFILALYNLNLRRRAIL